jgi:hypothetical protein
LKLGKSMVVFGLESIEPIITVELGRWCFRLES